MQQEYTTWKREVSAGSCWPAEHAWASRFTLCVLVSFWVKQRDYVSSPPYDSVFFEVKEKVRCLHKDDSVFKCAMVMIDILLKKDTIMRINTN